MHGGAKGSGAPLGNRNAVRHGLYSRESLARRRLVNRLLRDGARLLNRIGKGFGPVIPRVVGKGRDAVQHGCPLSDKAEVVRSRGQDRFPTIPEVRQQIVTEPNSDLGFRKGFLKQLTA